MSWQPPPAPPQGGPPPGGPAWPPAGGYGPPPGAGPGPPPGFGPPAGATPYPAAYGAGYGYPGAPGPAPGLLYASFGRRFLGYLLDGVILAIPAVVIFFVVAGASLSSYLNQVSIATQNGTARPTYVLPVNYYLVAGLFSAVLGFLYWGVLVGTWGKTVGQAAAGTRVVCQEDPGQRLPLSRAIARAVVWWGASLLEVVPAVGFIGGLITVFCLLWVAWDPYKQGLHDKLGRAIVVRDAPGFGVPYGPQPAWPPGGYQPPSAVP
jgi:uncharacterized RDD family membrane protein YckC